MRALDRRLPIEKRALDLQDDALAQVLNVVLDGLLPKPGVGDLVIGQNPSNSGQVMTMPA